MRCVLLLGCALVLATSAPAAGSTGTGGAAAPTTAGSVAFKQPIRKAPPARGPIGPVATRFTVAPAVLAPGTPATFALRIDGRADQVRVRIELTRRGAVAPTVRLRLGEVPTGRRVLHRWTPGEAELPPAVYDVALQAIDRSGRALHRTAKASGRGRLEIRVPPPPLPGTTDGVFPIAGAWSLGGEDARFGAGRPGHIHQGQDITAAEGTPLVAPLAASVYWIAFQRGGAGQYVVLRGIDGRDYVFMHLIKGSVTVTEGQPIAAGAPFGLVGSTGSSSGPHLHFEIWPDGWYSSKASAPIDPLPQLQAWAAAG
jgi:murein DD-endopeptidase MepM/ murein hydrolase activator NlpD